MATVATVLSAILFASFYGSIAATLLPGMSESVTVPQYVEIFDRAITLESFPSPPLDTSLLAHSEKSFYEVLYSVAKQTKYKDIMMKTIGKSQLAEMKAEAMQEMAKYSINRSVDMTEYHGIKALSQRNELMYYEAKMVELLQLALRGTEITVPFKRIRVTMIAAQRDFRDRGNNEVKWMGYLGLASGILAAISAYYFFRMRSEEGLEETHKS